MEYLKIKNWEEYQHYKDRCPPWIKLHVKILNDRAFSLLSRASKCLQMLLWILASETDGIIKNDINDIRFRLRDETIEESEINLLIEKGFLLPENNGRKHLLADACLETETETEKRAYGTGENRKQGDKMNDYTKLLQIFQNGIRPLSAIDTRQG